jgi:hypothetical protein
MESLGPRVYSFEKGLSYETRPNGLVVKKKHMYGVQNHPSCRNTRWLIGVLEMDWFRI